MFRKVPLVRVASFGAALLLILASCSEIFAPLDEKTVSSPEFSLAAGVYTTPQTITLSSPTSGAQIRYSTDGVPPSTSTGTLYAGPFVLTSSATVQAIAIKQGWTSSQVASRTFTINIPQPVADPTVSPDGGTFTSPQTITLSSATTGASFRYTLNGLEPNEFSAPYFGPFLLNGSATLKVIAIKTGMTNSNVVSRDFIINIPQPVADPTISPDGGTFTSAKWVSLTTDTPSASIYYTTNGSEPSASNGTLFTGDFLVSTTTTVKAIAIRSDMMDSQVVTTVFTINIGSGGIAVTVQ